MKYLSVERWPDRKKKTLSLCDTEEKGVHLVLATFQTDELADIFFEFMRARQGGVVTVEPHAKTI